jgi:hypothetical protein
LGSTPRVMLTHVLAVAAHGWSAGDPEAPPTALALRELANVMFQHGLPEISKFDGIRHPC